MEAIAKVLGGKIKKRRLIFVPIYAQIDQFVSKADEVGINLIKYGKSLSLRISYSTYSKTEFGREGRQCLPYSSVRRSPLLGVEDELYEDATVRRTLAKYCTMANSNSCLFRRLLCCVR